LHASSCLSSSFSVSSCRTGARPVWQRTTTSRESVGYPTGFVVS